CLYTTPNNTYICPTLVNQAQPLHYNCSQHYSSAISILCILPIHSYYINIHSQIMRIMTMSILMLHPLNNVTYINLLSFRSWKHSSGDALNVVLTHIHYMYSRSGSHLVCIVVDV